MLLLDTCTLIWLVAGSNDLSNRAKSEIQNSGGRLFVSSISALEIAIKVRNKKLKLPIETQDWFNGALTHHQIVEIPVNSTISVISANLPLYHTDPFDRIIVATAESMDLKIITPDKYIKKYTNVFW